MWMTDVSENAALVRKRCTECCSGLGKLQASSRKVISVHAHERFESYSCAGLIVIVINDKDLRESGLYGERGHYLIAAPQVEGTY